jgi:hypothetical protein
LTKKNQIFLHVIGTLLIQSFNLSDLIQCVDVQFQGEMVVTPGCYAHLINLLSVLAGGKMAVLLEVNLSCQLAKFFIIKFESN